MSHVTEGELHAYIDGALASMDALAAERIAKHLETCGDCEARIETARELRDRASVLLDTALGEPIEAPPFAEVVGKAGGVSGLSDSASARRPFRNQRLAWAASLVVALGAGWMANAVLPDSGGSPLQSIAVAEPEALAPTDFDAGRQSEAGRSELANAAPPATADGRTSVPESQNKPAAARTRNEAADAVAKAPAPALRREAGRETSEVAAANPVPATAQDEAQQARRRGESDAPVVAAGTPAELEERAERFADQRLVQTRLAEAEAPASAEQVAGDEVAKASDPRTDAVALEEGELDDLTWRRVEVVEAAEWVGGILTLPDAEVEEYALSTHEGQRLARVRQRLPGGETLELVQLGTQSTLDELREAPRRSLDRSALGAASAETGNRAGAFTLGWIEVNGVHVRASAPVAPDSLRTLISRIRRP